MKIGKKIINCIIFSTLLLVAPHAYSKIEEIDEEYVPTKRLMPGSDLSDFSDDLSFSMPTEYFAVQRPPSTFTLNPEMVVDLLVQAGALELLQQPLYLRTNVLNSRSLLDMPLFEPFGCLPTCGYIVDTSLFYNQTTRSFFDRDSSNINSYLALSEPSLIDNIEKIMGFAQDFLSTPLDVKRLFELFSFMTVQERRSGFMFHGMYQWPKGLIRFLVPLYWHERNFFLDDERKKAVEEILGAGDPKEQDQFQRNHFISDEFGLGDTRIEGFHQIIDWPSFELCIGGFLTVPTAARFARGWRGNKHAYPKPSSGPNFDFDALFSIIEKIITDGNSPTLQQQAVILLTDLMLGALDRLAANLLDTQLGNGRHLGIGVNSYYISPLSSWLSKCWEKKPWVRRIFFKGRASIEYLFQAPERRLFIKKIDVAGFNERDFSSTDQETATSNLLFLQEEFINKLYLYGYHTSMRPGPIFRLTNKMCYEGNKWCAYVGSDWWIQTREHINFIEAPKEIVDTLDVQKAKLPNAVQYKLFAGFDYTKHTKNYDLVLGLAADSTIYSIGIGKDYTIVAHLGFRF